MRRTVHALAAVALCLVLVGLVAPPATAATAVTASAAVGVAPAADPPDFTPSKGKWRKYIINVTSKLLGAATPRGWKAEQIANQYQYNFGAWDDLNARLGIDGVRKNSAGQIVGIKYTNRGQGTYTDVVIDGMEKQFTETGKRGGTGNKALTPPATKPGKWVKGVGGAATAFMAYELGTFLGSLAANGIGGLWGFDAQGVVCGNTGDDFFGSAVQFLSGQDCSMFKLNESYEPNSDSAVIAVTFQGKTVTYVGHYVSPIGQAFLCYSSSTGGSFPSSGYAMRYANGFGGYSQGWMVHGSALNSQCGEWKTMYARSAQDSKDPTFTIVNLATQEVVASTTTTNGNPTRKQGCTVTYDNGTSVTLYGVPYTESAGQVSPAPCPGTPPGRIPKSVKRTEQGGGSGGGSGGTQTISDDPVTEEYQEWLEKYPECATGACKLDLLKKTGTSTYAVSCFDLEDGCEGWNSDPDKADKYICRYGTHKVGLAECAVYANLFKPGAIDAGAAYVDPETGEWSGGQTSPKSGQRAFRARIQDPQKARNCDLSGLGFDPIGWVMRPVQCAFEWAFIPRPVVANVSFAGVRGVWEEKPPGAIAAAMNQVSINGSATGCSISTTYHGTTAPLINACGGFMQGLATFTRFAATALMAIAVFEKVRRQIAAMVNYNVGQD